MRAIRRLVLALLVAVAVLSVASIAAGIFLLSRGFEPGLIPVLIGAVLVSTTGVSTALVRRSLRADPAASHTGTS